MTKLLDRMLARREQAGLDVAPARTAVDTASHATNIPLHIFNETDIARDHDAYVLPVDAIVVRYQARKSFSRIAELAADILERGQLQAIMVRAIDAHQYLLLSGERRLRAMRDELQQSTILARIIRTDMDERAWRLTQLAENLQREDYAPLELAQAFADLKQQYHYSDTQLAQALHVNRTWVWRQLSLLEAPPRIQAAIAAGELAATEFLNNKARYLQAENARHDARNEPDSGNGSAVVAASRKTDRRIHTLVVSMKTARDLVEILQRLSSEYQLSPIELSGKPTKQELLAVLIGRTDEIKQRLHDTVMNVSIRS